MNATKRAPGKVHRDQIDVLAFFTSEGFRWRGTGGWVELGVCPFHKDSRPSLRGNLETGRARCMSCGWTGDPIAFVMQRHGLGFVDACKHLGAWQAVGGGL